MKPNLKLKPGTPVEWYDMGEARWMPAKFVQLYDVQYIRSGPQPWIQEPGDGPGSPGSGGWITWGHMRLKEYTVNKLGNFPRKAR